MKRVLIYSCFLVLLVTTTNAVHAVGEAQERRTITVTGDAEVRVEPDQVILVLGIESIDEQLNKAKEDNDERVTRVVALAAKHHIKPKRVQTDHLSIEPTYKSDYPSDKLVAYLVRRTVVFTLDNPDQFEALLSDALEAGADHVHGVTFRTTKLREHRDVARLGAIKAAADKAKALAGELGQRVGVPVSIREGHGGWWNSYNHWWGNRWGGGMAAQNVMQAATPGGTGDGASSIALGQISVTAQVTVTFEIE